MSKITARTQSIGSYKNNSQALPSHWSSMMQGDMVPMATTSQARKLTAAEVTQHCDDLLCSMHNGFLPSQLSYGLKTLRS